MSTGTSIEWTDTTWNPVTGCTRVSAGCDHCYAVLMTHRLAGMGQAAKKYGGLTVLNGRGERHFNGVVRCHEEALGLPLRWRKPRRVFVNSMSDLHHKDVPLAFIDRVAAVMALCPQHTFQILTKRPEAAAEYWTDFYQEGGRLERMMDDVGFGGDAPLHDLIDELPDHRQPRGGDLYRRLAELDVLPNVWLGTSVENQAAADERIPHLLKCPAAVRFVSCEPLLGAVDLEPWLCSDCKGTGRVGLSDDPRELVRCGGCLGDGNNGLHWVIVGGESGAGARACDVAWVRSIVGQCRAAGVSVFVKQLGKWVTGPHDFQGWKGRIDRWLLRDADGKEYTYHRPVIRAQLSPQFYDERPENAVAWGFADQKGGEMAMWPDDLQVREMPPGEEGSQCGGPAPTPRRQKA